MENMYQLSGFIQPYAWGGKSGITNLLNLPSPASQPQAELWMGAHPKGPAVIHLPNEEKMNLNQWLSGPGKSSLGKKVINEFDGTLPFLFKVLDVHDMLSIQAHPDKERAQIGFIKEEKLGIPTTAYNRVFRDANHKPELMLALTDFYLLHGFKSAQQISISMARYEQWKILHDYLQISIEKLYRHIMTCPQETINLYLQPLYEELVEKPLANLLKTSPDYWAKKAFSTYTNQNGDFDRGILSIFLMHILKLNPGEAIYQDAGILHAYLEGLNVEIMANSDNVFRGGLTIKHIAVHELLNHTILQNHPPFMVDPIKIKAGEVKFPTPAPDFELSQIKLGKTTPKWSGTKEGPTIGLILHGKMKAASKIWSKGDHFYIPSNQAITMSSIGKDEATIVLAALPQ
ncbi:MAG: mannose-6-phosphate isomerase, class I [Saprospiraceae bacterium]|nr:mannose-6-phosphate isomerase, class I [Saprospiraceae bacterium]